VRLAECNNVRADRERPDRRRAANRWKPARSAGEKQAKTLEPLGLGQSPSAALMRARDHRFEDHSGATAFRREDWLLLEIAVRFVRLRAALETAPPDA